MTTRPNHLKNLRIASPCHKDWDYMSGDERVRFCDACSFHVYNFSEMTSNEINELIVKTEGRLCGRLYRRSDGTIITRDCPVGLKAFRKKISLIGSAAFATLLSACSFVFAQDPKKDKSCKEVPAVTLDRKKHDKNQSPLFTGRVLDPMGAVLPGATVTLLNDKDQKVRETKTSDTGEFSLIEIPDGTYALLVTALGFKNLLLEKIEFRSDEIATAKLVLNLDENVVWIGITATAPNVEMSNGTMIIRGDALRKLPIN